MYHVSPFEGNRPLIGNFGVLSSSPQAPPRNTSHIQELYQNLPQLHNPVFLPVEHKPYEIQNRLPPEHSVHQHSTFFQSPYHKTTASKYSKPRYDQELERDQIMHKRNGYGWGDAGHYQHHGHGNSSALSALALLGFMFFLQLIQNSLQNNRQMLAAAALNATTVGVVAGRDNKQTMEYIIRQRRSLDENQETSPNIKETVSEANPHRTATKPSDHHERAKPSETRASQMNFLPNKTQHITREKNQKTNHTMKENSPFEILKSSSVHCCQLIACKIGESIYDSLDATTGLMIRMLGATMIPRIPKKTWTGRLLRAFDRGSKKESCDSIYRKCLIFYNLFHHSKNITEGRKRNNSKPLKKH